VDTGNVIYREHLAQRSLELIRQHPFFGDQLALQKMQNLRQGMGIIDLVNTYTTIAVLYGLVGLSLFMTFIIVALYRALSVVKRLQQPDPDFALLGTSLIACIVGTLVMIAGTSFIFAYEKMFYVLAGLAAAYIRLGETPPPQSPASPPTARLSALPSS
jgi:O-antigen ligase